MNEEYDEVICMDCKKHSLLKDLPIKMGGLLCPKCRVILIWPENKLFLQEMHRRRAITIQKGEHES